MRVKVGRVVDVDKEVNLADLSPMDRVIAAATNAYRNTALYKRRYAETEEKKEEQRRQIREALADALLAAIHPELDSNQTLKDSGDQCLGILIKVPSRFKSFLSDVIETHEFDAYSVTIIPPSRALSRFCDPPYLLYVENREGVR